MALLSPYDTVILAGTNAPVAFFGYRNGRSFLLNETAKTFRIDTSRQCAVDALEALADSLDAAGKGAGDKIVYTDYRVPKMPFGRLTAEKACAAVAALQPENAIIVDEGLTSTMHYFSLSAGLAPHSYITNTGGAIGQGMPCAVGAAVAHPDRPVINLQADGSAMYTVQALWTQAREGLNVTTLICANRQYSILQVEFLRAGYTSFGSKMLSLTDLNNPVINWCWISQGMGVPGVSVETCEQLAKEFKNALAEPGPHLIEMIFR
jgi:acetolactate synthase-1/2/3 large subunit